MKIGRAEIYWKWFPVKWYWRLDRNPWWVECEWTLWLGPLSVDWMGK